MTSPEESESTDMVKLKSGKMVRISTHEKARHKARDAGFGEWNMEAKLLYFGHLFWLLQELCWILLFSYPAFLFSFASTVLVAIVVYRRRDGGASGKLYNEAGAELTVNVIQLLWLGVSFLNCVADFSFDLRSDDETPAYAKGFVNLCTSDAASCKNTNDALTVVIQVGFGITIATWLGSCVYLLYLWIKPPVFVAQGYAFQTCLLEGGWISFWVLTDVVASFGENALAWAVVTYCIHFVLLVFALIVQSSKSRITLWDGLDATELEALSDVFCRVDLVVCSYILWSLSTLLWVLTELAFEEDLTCRIFAALMCASAICLFLAGYNQAKQRGMILRALKDYAPPQEQGGNNASATKVEGATPSESVKE
eukprot:TRINITY_DN28812_c0_g1_i1.p1 TRINITY_DN28812_c0_g1~~TRINITY_DN28812_c0_g1_i1.p1  ORF type:complete len:398 (+),score=31.44 TRINITY_DN28812_c0_g1_i1:93-1196(+)